MPASADGQRHVEVGLPGGAAAGVRHGGDDPLASTRTGRPCGAGGRSLAFALPDAAGLDALHAELVAAGHESELAPFDAFWGQRYAIVLDPDGNGVDLFAPLAS